MRPCGVKAWPRGSCCSARSKRESGATPRCDLEARFIMVVDTVVEAVAVGSFNTHTHAERKGENESEEERGGGRAGPRACVLIYI